MNIRKISSSAISIAFDETSSLGDVDALLRVLNGGYDAPFTAAALAPAVEGGVGPFARSSSFLQQPIFNTYHNEHDMLR